MGIDDFLAKYNTEEVLNAVIVMAFDQTVEKEFLIPASEMLASNVLCKYKIDSDYDFDSTAYNEMKMLASDILAPKVQQLMMNAMQHMGDTDTEKGDFLKSILMQLKNVSYRGDGYMFQLIELSENFYLPFDADMKEKSL